MPFGFVGMQLHLVGIIIITILQAFGCKVGAPLSNHIWLPLAPWPWESHLPAHAAEGSSMQVLTKRRAPSLVWCPQRHQKARAFFAQGPLNTHPIGIPCRSQKVPTQIPHKSNADLIRTPYRSHRDPTQTQCKTYTDAMGIPCRSHRGPIQVLHRPHTNLMQIQ